MAGVEIWMVTAVPLVALFGPPSGRNELTLRSTEMMNCGMLPLGGGVPKMAEAEVSVNVYSPGPNGPPLPPPGAGAAAGAPMCAAAAVVPRGAAAVAAAANAREPVTMIETMRTSRRTKVIAKAP